MAITNTDIVSPGTDQIVIYGNKRCKYEQIKESKSLNAQFKKIFDFRIGSHPLVTIENRSFLSIKPNLTPNQVEELIKERDPKGVSKICKTALLNLVIENCKRKAESRPLIPLLFLVDISNNPHQLADAKFIFSDDSLVTNKELRRCYKLFKLEDESDPLFQSIGTIAKESTKFVKVVNPDTINLQSIPDFYKEREWNEAHAERLKRRGIVKNLWKSELLAHVKEFNQTFEEKQRVLSGLKSGLISPKDLEENYTSDPFFMLKAAEVNDQAILSANNTLRGDPKFMLNAIQISKRLINFIDPNLIEDACFMFDLFGKNNFDLSLLDEPLKSNENMMLKLLYYYDNKGIITDLTAELPNEEVAQASVENKTFKTLFLKILKKNRYPMCYASKTLTKNESFLLKATKANKFAMTFSSEELTLNLKYMLQQLAVSELAIAIAHTSLLDNEEFMKAVVKKEKRDLQYASPRLQTKLSLDPV